MATIQDILTISTPITMTNSGTGALTYEVPAGHVFIGRAIGFTSPVGQVSVSTGFFWPFSSSPTGANGAVSIYAEGGEVIAYSRATIVGRLLKIPA